MKRELYSLEGRNCDEVPNFGISLSDSNARESRECERAMPNLVIADTKSTRDSSGKSVTSEYRDRRCIFMRSAGLD